MDAKTLKKRDLILNGSIMRAISSIAAPLIVGNLFQTLYNLADAYWVGNKLGSTAFAAVSFVWPIIFIFIALSIGLTIASTSLIAQAIGKEMYQSGNKIIGQFFLMSVVSGILFAIIGYLGTPFFVRLMGAEDDIYQLSVSYLQIAFFEIPLIFLFQVYRSMAESQGDTLSPTILMSISVVINIILDPIFIVNLNLGIQGAAYATLVSRLLLIFYFVRKLFDPTKLIHLKLKYLRFDRTVASNLLRVAIPASVGQTMSALGFAVMNSFIISYGVDTTAAFQLGNKITSIFMMPAMGFGGALSTFVGQNLGAKNYDRVKKGVATTILLSFSILTIGSIVTYFTSAQLVTFFIKDSPVIFELSIEYMNVLCFVFPLMAIFQGFLGVFSGSGHTKYTFYITLSRLWVLRIPLILISKHFTDLGSTGIWYSMLISNIIICFVEYLIFKREKWTRSTLLVHD